MPTHKGAKPSITTGVAVIGAGTAGLSAERAARAAGAETLIIDPEFDGTMCANVGCMPSKLLIAAARAAQGVRSAKAFGIATERLRIDGAAVMDRVRRERDRFAAATRQSMDDLPPHAMIRSSAHFVRPGVLELDDGRTVSAAAVVIATGSAPAMPPPFEKLGDLALTNNSIFEMKNLPESLAVIGGGAIGLEMAQAFGMLGVRVALFDAEKRLGKARSHRIDQAIKNAVSRDVNFHLGVEPSPHLVQRKVRLEWEEDGKPFSEDFARVLVAAGRPPVIDGLNLEKLDLERNEHGVPVFDRDTMQCGGHAIFLAGDVNDDAPFLHEASIEGSIAGRNAALFPDVKAIPRPGAFSIIFCEPNVASIGAGPEESALSGTGDYSNQGRARVENRAEGLVEIYADETGKLTGADLCAPGGEHLAHLLSWAIEAGLGAAELLAMPFYHPTLEEGLKTALREICKAANRNEPEGRDTGSAPGV